MKPILFANGLIFNDGFRFIGTIVVDNGRIQRVDAGRISLSTVDREAYDICDCEGRMVLPGVIDAHVHFRQPGLTEKGDLHSESLAAIAGGVTSYFDMPNTAPATTTIETWEQKNRMASEVSAANYAFFMGVTNSNIEHLLHADPTRIPGLKLFLGSSTGDMLVDDDSTIIRLFLEFKGVIACHAESERRIVENRQRLLEQYPDGIPLKLHHMLRSRQACVEASAHAIELARRTGARLHLLHVSTEDELALLSDAPLSENRISAETCPHYLYFDASSVETTGGLTKCNPAIKEDSDRRALLRALRDGRIDIVATDHAPHLLAQKQGNALTAASGMPSIQFALPLMLQLARNGNFTYESVVEKMCNNPARLYAIDRRGFIRPRYWADFAIIDPDADYTITNDDVISTCGWTPYAGQHLTFRVEQTWLNGRLAYDYRRTLPGNPAGPQSPFTGEQTALPIRFNPF